jgi:hypothetical protein
MTTAIKDMGVDHRGLQLFMPQQFLYGADVLPAFQQVSSERMAQGVGGCWLENTCIMHGLANCALQPFLVNMMPSDNA